MGNGMYLSIRTYMTIFNLCDTIKIYGNDGN